MTSPDRGLHIFVGFIHFFHSISFSMFPSNISGNSQSLVQHNFILHSFIFQFTFIFHRFSFSPCPPLSLSPCPFPLPLSPSPLVSLSIFSPCPFLLSLSIFSPCPFLLSLSQITGHIAESAILLVAVSPLKLQHLMVHCSLHLHRLLKLPCKWLYDWAILR